MPCYTHKTAIVSWPQILWRHVTLVIYYPVCRRRSWSPPSGSPKSRVRHCSRLEAMPFRHLLSRRVDHFVPVTLGHRVHRMDTVAHLQMTYDLHLSFLGDLWPHYSWPMTSIAELYMTYDLVVKWIMTSFFGDLWPRLSIRSRPDVVSSDYDLICSWPMTSLSVDLWPRCVWRGPSRRRRTGVVCLAGASGRRAPAPRYSRPVDLHTTTQVEGLLGIQASGVFGTRTGELRGPRH